jgi:hypothetical protein
MDQPPQGAAYPIFSGYVTLAPGGTFELPFDWTPPTGGSHRVFIDGDDQPGVDIEVTGPPPLVASPPNVTVDTTACIQINLPGAIEGTCPKPPGQSVPPQGIPISPGQSEPAAICMEIGRDDGQLQVASYAADQACAKPCNYGVIMSVGFKTASDLDLPDKPPRQHALMDANATALQGALIDNWGFPAKDLQNYTFTNTAGTKNNAKRGFTYLLDKVKNLPTSCTSSTVVFHFDGHGTSAKSVNGIPGLWATAPNPPPNGIYVAVETADSADANGMIGSKANRLLFDFELADRVKQLSAALGKQTSFKFKQVVVQINTCFSEWMVNSLIGVPDVSLAWGAGKTGYCEVVGRPNLSPWVKAFVQPFEAADGSTDPKKNVTIEDAHKVASAATTNGADYSPHGQAPAVNPNPKP